MKRSWKALSILSALVLVGAGCTSSPSVNTNTPSTAQDESQSEESTVPAGDEGETTESEAVSTTVEIDDTWKTYTNSAMGYEFKYPIHGLYVPRWKVSVEKEGSANIKDGCFVFDGGTDGNISVDGTAFCRTKMHTDMSAKNVYATKIGSSYVVITFTKAVTTKMSSDYWDAYDASLDQVISTFRLTK